MKLSERKAGPSLIKMILMGVSGSGKSSATIALAIPDLIPGWPGKELRVLDFDGKFEEVAIEQLEARKDKAKARRSNLTPITEEQYQSALSNIDIIVCREKTKIIQQGVQSKVGTQTASAWDKAIKALKKWQVDFSPNNILLVDSLTHMATIAITNYTQSLNGKLNQDLTWRDFLAPQREVAASLQFFSDTDSHCIITGHQGPLDVKKKTGEFRELPNGVREEIEEVVDSLMLPLSVGSAGRIAIPAQLNHMLVIADDKGGTRRLYTKPHNGVITKSPFFAVSEPTYDLDKGLVQYFNLANR